MPQGFAEEIQQAQEAEAAEKARADKLEADLAQAEHELSEVGASSSELDSLEERYWHDFNDFQLQLRAHVDERDVLLNKVCACSPLSYACRHCQLYFVAATVSHTCSSTIASRGHCMCLTCSMPRFTHVVLMHASAHAFKTVLAYPCFTCALQLSMTKHLFMSAVTATCILHITLLQLYNMLGGGRRWSTAQPI